MVSWGYENEAWCHIPGSLGGSVHVRPSPCSGWAASSQQPFHLGAWRPKHSEPENRLFASGNGLEWSWREVRKCVKTTWVLKTSQYHQGNWNIIIIWPLWSKNLTEKKTKQTKQANKQNPDIKTLPLGVLWHKPEIPALVPSCGQLEILPLNYWKKYDFGQSYFGCFGTITRS